MTYERDKQWTEGEVRLIQGSRAINGQAGSLFLEDKRLEDDWNKDKEWLCGLEKLSPGGWNWMWLHADTRENVIKILTKGIVVPCWPWIHSLSKRLSSPYLFDRYCTRSWRLIINKAQLWLYESYCAKLGKLPPNPACFYMCLSEHTYTHLPTYYL